MNVLALAAKSCIAVMLLVAGGTKLADLGGFTATVRLFLPPRTPRAVALWCAAGITALEVALGAASLSLPVVGWLNPVVLALACGFLAISAIGYIAHRGRSCRCFGALSGRRFDIKGTARTAVIVMVAAIPVIGPGTDSTDIAAGHSVLLALVGGLVTLAAFTAARSLSFGRQVGLVRE